MKIDGACLCGAIRYSAEIDPDKVIVCHCTDCQIGSGGAFRWGTVIARAQFVLEAGAPKFYRKIAESGRARSLAFCGDCGTSLYGTQADDPQSYSLRLSTARQAAQLKPMAQIWDRSRVAWLGEVDQLPRFETQPETL